MKFSEDDTLLLLDAQQEQSLKQLEEKGRAAVLTTGTTGVVEVADTINVHLDNLEKKGLIEARYTDDATFVRLTEAGTARKKILLESADLSTLQDAIVRVTTSQAA